MNAKRTSNQPGELVRLLRQRYEDEGDTISRKAADEIELLKAAIVDAYQRATEQHINSFARLAMAIETLKPLAFDIADVAPDQSDTRAWGYGARDMQPWRMRFDPATGEPNPYPSHAEQYRDYHGCVAWLLNPWTGTARDARDIGTDVYGHLIVFKEPNK